MKTENIEDMYELTPIQKGLLFQSLYEPELGVYFFQVSFTLHGNLNVVAFDRAWQQVAARHTALRTGFYWENLDKPLQIVYRQVKVPLEELDLRGIDSIEQQKHLQSFLESDRQKGFDLSQECLMRLTLIRLTDDSYQFVWSHHFIIIDGWSIPLIFKDLIEFYEALCRGQDLPSEPSIPYRYYIEWLQRQDLSKVEAYWRQALNGIQAPTPLFNLDVEERFSLEERYNEQRVYISTATTAALQSLARKHQLTASTLFQGVWALLLGRYSCHHTVVYGCTVSGRPADLVGVESMVGMLINTLPVKVKVDTEQSLLEWLKQLQAQLLEMRQYEYSPLVEIQGWSQVPRKLPLFESILIYENLPIDPVVEEWQGDLKVSDHVSYYKTNYPLTIAVYPGLEICIGINYDFRRFDAATISNIQEDFEILLQGMVNHPDVLVKDLLLLVDREQHIYSLLEKEVTFDFDFDKTATVS
jgi:hypothetical protein